MPLRISLLWFYYYFYVQPSGNLAFFILCRKEAALRQREVGKKHGFVTLLPLIPWAFLMNYLSLNNNSLKNMFIIIITSPDLNKAVFSSPFLHFMNFILYLSISLTTWIFMKGSTPTGCFKRWQDIKRHDQ